MAHTFDISTQTSWRWVCPEASATWTDLYKLFTTHSSLFTGRRGGLVWIKLRWSPCRSTITTHQATCENNLKPSRQETVEKPWGLFQPRGRTGARWLRAPLHTESPGHPDTTPTSAAHCCLYIECVFIGSNYSALPGQWVSDYVVCSVLFFFFFDENGMKQNSYKSDQVNMQEPNQNILCPFLWSSVVFPFNYYSYWLAQKLALFHCS